MFEAMRDFERQLIALWQASPVKKILLHIVCGRIGWCDLLEAPHPYILSTLVHAVLRLELGAPALCHF